MWLLLYACSSPPPPPGTLPSDVAIFRIASTGVTRTTAHGLEHLPWEHTVRGDMDHSPRPRIWTTDAGMVLCGHPFEARRDVGWDCWSIDDANRATPLEIALPPGDLNVLKDRFRLGRDGSWVASDFAGQVVYQTPGHLPQEVTFAPSRAVRFDSRQGVFWALDREGVLTHRTVQGPSVTVKLPSPVREDDEPEIELSPDGQWLAYPAHDGVWLVSQTGDTRHLLPLGTNLDGTPESLNVLDWSPDGRRLLVATSRFLPKTTSSSWVNGNSTRPTFLLASLSLDSGELTPLGVRGQQGRWGPSTVR